MPCCEPGGYAVQFTNAERGFAVGVGVFRTLDRGETWTVQYLPEQPNAFLGVSFVDDQRGWVVSYDTIMHTDDGGETWVAQWTNVYAGLHSVAAVDENTAIAVGYGSQGFILRTSDGGAHWEEQLFPGAILTSVSFAGMSGTAVGWYGHILRSDDGGQNWHRQESGTTGYLFSVWQTDAKIATAVGSEILRTVDGGQTWYPQAVDLYDRLLRGVSFSDVDNGIAVGYGGLILRTTTGGEETPERRGPAR